MIAVGIPSYNEADNIGELIARIDKAAFSIGEPIAIINADNSSSDGTADVFRSVKTSHQKISLPTCSKGKGRNVQAILKYVVDNGYDYCFFVDADVKSFEPEWLSLHAKHAYRAVDYVVPNYSRKLQEGNATNQFFYPLLNYHTQGKAPYQPIAGDIGVSWRLAKYLTTLEWSSVVLGYGIDIFIAMHALFGGFKTIEINLYRKIHKPSYGKMITIFEEAATSYFEVRSTLKHHATHVDFMRSSRKPFTLLQGEPIAQDEIATRKRFALELFKTHKNRHQYAVRSTGIDEGTWASALANHEALVGRETPAAIAKSLLPFYLLRVTDYLSNVVDPDDAVVTLDRQTALIAKQLAAAEL